jgi:ADP-dependent NAD(P)H-hydrate dehydratase / NAD(P)H-hydrate epimerase
MGLMKNVLTPERMAEADQATFDSGVPSFELMRRAGRAVGRAAVRYMGGAYGRRVAVVCGKGNNGGDGFVAAQYLLASGALCRVFTMEDPKSSKGDARTALELLGVHRTQRFDRLALRKELARSALAIDALLGTGFKGSLSGPAADAVAEVEASGVPVVGVDIPSGVDGRTGAVEGRAVKAVLTVTLGALKPGLLLPPGAEHAGEVEIADIGIPDELLTSDIQLVEEDDIASVLSERPTTAHKRSVGKVIVVAGSPGMSGAAALAVLGALRTGAGLVRMVVPDSIAERLDAGVMESLTVGLPQNERGGLRLDGVDQVLALAAEANAVAIGPGIGRDEETQKFVRRVLEEVEQPVILDADGINAFQDHPEELRTRRGPTVLTPHSGELARLTGASVDQINGDRVTAARQGARQTAAIVLLKGFCTVVAKPDGEAMLVRSGGPVLATGGTGDVLTGVIAALAAGQDPFAAAWAGAYIHGAAGHLLAARVGDRGVIAGDLLDVLPEVISRVRP